MKLVPLGDRVVLKQLVAEETTKSGIVLPGQSKEKPQQAEVIAVGPGGTVDGKEVKMEVKVGDKVAKNQEVAVLEAMKMENSIISPCDGTVASIAVKEQESVSEGQVLMTIA